MGIDACIYIKTTNGETPTLEWDLPQDFELKRARKYAPLGSTHEVITPARFYGPRYARGPWPVICGVLMTLIASNDVETVWYCGDSGDEENDEPFTKELVIAYSAFFMENGNRPYGV